MDEDDHVVPPGSCRGGVGGFAEGGRLRGGPGASSQAPQQERFKDNVECFTMEKINHAARKKDTGGDNNGGVSFVARGGKEKSCTTTKHTEKELPEKHRAFYSHHKRSSPYESPVKNYAVFKTSTSSPASKKTNLTNSERYTHLNDNFLETSPLTSSPGKGRNWKASKEAESNRQAMGKRKKREKLEMIGSRREDMGTYGRVDSLEEPDQMEQWEGGNKWLAEGSGRLPGSAVSNSMVTNEQYSNEHSARQTANSPYCTRERRGVQNQQHRSHSVTNGDCESVLQVKRSHSEEDPPEERVTYPAFSRGGACESTSASGAKKKGGLLSLDESETVEDSEYRHGDAGVSQRGNTYQYDQTGSGVKCSNNAGHGQCINGHTKGVGKVQGVLDGKSELNKRLLMEPPVEQYSPPIGGVYMDKYHGCNKSAVGESKGWEGGQSGSLGGSATPEANYTDRLDTVKGGSQHSANYLIPPNSSEPSNSHNTNLGGHLQQSFSSPNHVPHRDRGVYSSIPVVRVDLAEDVEVQNDIPAEPRFQSDRNRDSIDRRSTGYSMEADEDGSIPHGGLQAIDLEELHRRRKQRRKRKIKFMKNIIILSFAFVFLFSATSGLTLLQSSLNRQKGVFGLCANFTAVAISCLLLPKALIQFLGCKWTIVASMACFMLWIMSNLHPTYGTLVPTAVVMGTGWAPLWTAQCTYFTVTGIEYAKWGDHMPDVVIARMFGFFFMIFMTAPIWGNLLSSSVLSTGFYNRTRPLPLPGDPESIYRFCGAADCPEIYENTTNENYNRPENSLVYTLVSLYLGLSLIGLTLVAFFLDGLDLDREPGKPRCVPGSLTASFKQITNPYQIFIIPLTVYTGMEQVFLMVEYSRAYATCALGIEKIGYVVSSYAAVAAIMSLTCSQLVNVVGRMPLFLIGAGAHIGCMVVFMRWTPYPDSLIMFIIMPAIWGIGDAIWQSQINAFYGVLFSDQSEAAFSNYRMWESVGFIMSLSYSPFLCVYRKIHILLGVLITGLLGYFVVEGLYSKACSERETELAKKGVIIEADSTPEDDAPFGKVAQMIRRKSSVYIPQRAVRDAAEVMRRKSQVFLGGVDHPERVIRRRLSTFAPVMEVAEDNTPLSSAPSTPAATHQQRDISPLTMEDLTGTNDVLESEMEVQGNLRNNGIVISPAREAIGRIQHYNV